MIILAAAFCVVVACVSIYTVSSITHQQPPQTKPASKLVTEASVKVGTLDDMEGGQEELDEIIKEGLVTSSINTTPSLQTGGSRVNLLIENPSDSGTRFAVTITRDDTGEEIYQSGYLDPEQYIGKTPLDVVLPKGGHPCAASFNSYRVKDSSYLGCAVAKITIYVLN